MLYEKKVKAFRQHNMNVLKIPEKNIHVVCNTQLPHTRTRYTVDVLITSPTYIYIHENSIRTEAWSAKRSRLAGYLQIEYLLRN